MSRSTHSLLLILSLICPGVALGQVYKYVDKDGVLNLTNMRPTNAAGPVETIRFSCYACNPRSSVAWERVSLYTDRYNALIRSAALRHEVPEALVRAVIHAESAYNRWAISSAGARGLMQLMPATMQRYGIDNPFDAFENIEGGVLYLRFLRQTFDDERKVIAAYNAGHGAVARFGGIPPYAETQVFVERVSLLKARYEKAIAEGLIVETEATANSIPDLAHLRLPTAT